MAGSLASASDFAFAVASLVLLPSRKASRASEGGGALEQPMSERSEFGPRHREAANVPSLAGKRRSPARLRRDGSRPAGGLAGSFPVLQKATRTRSGRKPCTCSALLSPRQGRLVCRAGGHQARSFHARRARLTFVWSKVARTVFAGRDPAGLRSSGPLRAAPDAARRPDSLRSDRGAFTAAPGCGARPALRLGTSIARATAEVSAAAGARARVRAAAHIARAAVGAADVRASWSARA